MYAPHWTVLPNLGMDAIGAALLRIGTARYLDDWRASFDYVLLIDREASMPTPHGLMPVYHGSYAQLFRIDRCIASGEGRSGPFHGASATLTGAIPNKSRN
jgi:hypothetical protein